MEPLIVNVEVVLWSLDEVLEETGSVVDPDDWAVVDEAKICGCLRILKLLTYSES
jgi:hypothetical protein